MYLESSNEFIAQYIEDKEAEVSYADFMSSRGLSIIPKPMMLSDVHIAQIEADKMLLMSLY